MTSVPVTSPEYRFPAEVISHTVWLHHVFSLSLRHAKLILAQRGIIVTRVSIRNWSCKMDPGFAAKLRRRRPKPGDTWHLMRYFCALTASCIVSSGRWTSTA